MFSEDEKRIKSLEDQVRVLACATTQQWQAHMNLVDRVNHDRRRVEGLPVDPESEVVREIEAKTRDVAQARDEWKAKAQRAIEDMLTAATARDAAIESLGIKTEICDSQSKIILDMTDEITGLKAGTDELRGQNKSLRATNIATLARVDELEDEAEPVVEVEVHEQEEDAPNVVADDLETAGMVPDPAPPISRSPGDPLIPVSDKKSKSTYNPHALATPVEEKVDKHNPYGDKTAPHKVWALLKPTDDMDLHTINLCLSTIYDHVIDGRGLRRLLDAMVGDGHLKMSTKKTPTWSRT